MPRGFCAMLNRMRRNERVENMTPRLFVFLAIAGLASITEAAAQTVCPNGASPSASGICPVFVQGDPNCNDAAQICSIVQGLQVPLVFSPPPGTQVGVTVTLSGTSAVVKDTNITFDQQLGRPGIEAIIARRNSAYIYCGTEILNDIVKAPGNQAPNQVTVCFAKGPCGLEPGPLTSACNAYNPVPTSPTANFIQAYKVGPIEQAVNICGCSPFAARFCDVRAPVFAGPGDTNPRFVACNQDASPLKSVEAEGTATIGTNSCVMRTIGGRRILIDTATGSLC